MDFRSLLQSMTSLSEAETKVTKTGKVHKGDYGTSYEAGDEGVKKAETTRGRGRPKKGSDETTGEVKKYDTKSVGDVFGGGKKPKKEVGTVSKKHSLKEYMEAAEEAINEGATIEKKGGRVHKGSYGTSYEAGDEGVKKQETQRGRGRPKKDADEKGEVKKYDTKSLGNVFGGGKAPNKNVGKVSASHKIKEGQVAPVEIKPASQTQTQVIQQGNKTLGTVNNPQLAAQIKQSIGKGEMSFNPNEEELNEIGDTPQGQQRLAKVQARARDRAWDKRSATDTAYAMKQSGAFTGAQSRLQQQGQMAEESNPIDHEHYRKQQERQARAKQKQGMAEGKKPDFLDMDKDGDKKEPMKKAVADKKKNPFAKKVDESRDQDSSEYLDEKVAKILAREKPGMATVRSNDAFYGAIYHELIACGLTPKAARYKVSYDEDFISDVASAYNHYQKNPSLDEDVKDDFAMRGIGPTSDFTQPGGSMAVPRGTPTQRNRPVPNPTSWKTDPISAASDRTVNFISSLGKNNTLEGKDMKDMQVESWSKQLNSLLTEGITVSSSQGQQGAPDSVSVTANDADAEKLLGVLRNAGIGGFGAGEQQPDVGYGVTQGGEGEFDGTGTEPQPAPGVVGDGDDMLSMMKKMAGLAAGPVGSEQGGQDYEDEEGSEVGELEPASAEEEGSEAAGEEEYAGDEDEEEVTDEGNAFTGKLKQTPQGGEFKMGDKEYKDTSNIEEEHDHEEVCETCQMEACECDDEQEQVEENFANSANDPAQTELMKLKALLSVGNDMHKLKHSQAMGNPIKVAESNTISDWKKLSGI